MFVQSNDSLQSTISWYNMRQSLKKPLGHSKVYAELGKVYRIVELKKTGLLPPLKAKWQIVYWEFVVYFTNKGDAEHKCNGLPYYQQEDARLTRL